MKIKKINGLVAAPFTPMKKDGSINPEIIGKYAEKLKTDGVKGAFVCGTTGEGMFMTNAERKKVTEKWLAEQTDDFKVIVHVGTTSAKQSQELAAHAQRSGAYATGCMGPVFLKPGNVDLLVDFCVEVASGSPDLPFYYYHIPSVSGIDLPMQEFIQKASARIPNFAGLKFTHNNFLEMQQCLNLDNGKWDILHGFDEMLLAGLALGAKGAVGSTYNFMAPLYNQIIEDFEKGNLEEARKKQLSSVKIIEVLIKHGGPIVSGKAVMKWLGIDCGGCRAPLPRFTKNCMDSFLSEMKNVLFFDIIRS